MSPRRLAQPLTIEAVQKKAALLRVAVAGLGDLGSSVLNFEDLFVPVDALAAEVHDDLATLAEREQLQGSGIARTVNAAHETRKKGRA